MKGLPHSPSFCPVPCLINVPRRSPGPQIHPVSYTCPNPVAAPRQVPRPGQMGNSLLSPKNVCVGNGRTFLVMSPTMALPGASTRPLVISTEILSCFPTLCRSHVSLVPHTISIHTWGTSTLTPTCMLSVCFSFAHSHPSPPTHTELASSSSVQGLCSRPGHSVHALALGLNCSHGMGLDSPSQGLFVAVPSQRAGEGVGERGIRNLNARLFSIPCAVHLSK